MGKMPSEFIDLTEFNVVKRNGQLITTQLIFYRWCAGEYRIVGYLKDSQHLDWDVSESQTSVRLLFTARNGERRKILAKAFQRTETDKDFEMLDRERDRECLFGLYPFGDVRGEL